MCVFDRTEDKFELEQVISMQLRNKITVARDIRIHHHGLLTMVKCKAQDAVVLS